MSFIVFLIQCILSHLQHNIIECMRGVYVLIKHSSLFAAMLRIWRTMIARIGQAKQVSGREEERGGEGHSAGAWEGETKCVYCTLIPR